MTAITGSHAVAGLRPLQSERLKSFPFIRHGITRRLESHGQAEGNVSYSSPRNKSEAWQMRQLWGWAIGIDPLKMVTAGQVHRASVGLARSTDAGIGSAPGTGLLGEFDSLITGEPRVPLMLMFADCLPILLCHPKARAVGVVHAGWRGTTQNAAGLAVQAMIDAFAISADDLVAYLGPAICKSCYVVGQEVIDCWIASYDNGAAAAIDRTGESWTFDLAEANAIQLRAAGLRPASIERSNLCTICTGGSWFSHRGQGAGTGRFGAIIGLAD